MLPKRVTENWKMGEKQRNRNEVTDRARAQVRFCSHFSFSRFPCSLPATRFSYILNFMSSSMTQHRPSIILKGLRHGCLVRFVNIANLHVLIFNRTYLQKLLANDKVATLCENKFYPKSLYQKLQTKRIDQMIYMIYMIIWFISYTSKKN